jgi:hypothetical protein
MEMSPLIYGFYTTKSHSLVPSYQEEKIASSLLLGGMIGPVVATYLPGSLAPSPAAVRTKDGTGPALVGSTSHRRGVTGVLKRDKLGPLGGF